MSTSLDDHASDHNTAQQEAASTLATSKDLSCLQKDIIGTTAAAAAAAANVVPNYTVPTTKNVEHRRKELNELWHKLSKSSSEQRRHEEEQPKKQGSDEDRDNKNYTNEQTVDGDNESQIMAEASVLLPNKNNLTEAVPPPSRQKREEEERLPHECSAADVSLSIGLPGLGEEEKKHDMSSMSLSVVHSHPHPEHPHHHVVQVQQQVGADGTSMQESIVLADSLAHDSMAFSSMRSAGGARTCSRLAMSSTRPQQVVEKGRISSTPIPSAAKVPPPQQQQQQQQYRPPQVVEKDYLRHGTAPSAVGQPKKAGTSWWERVVVQRSSYVVEDLVDQYTADSLFLQSPALPVAYLDRIELHTSQLLGSGTYSNVYRVQQLQLLPEYLMDHPQQAELRKDFVDTSHQAQASTDAGVVITNPSSASSIELNKDSSTGYAIKHLKSELLQNSKLFEAAAADLIMEAKFLSRLDHPNILKLRGMALGGTSTFAATGLYDSYFLVVDELQETLVQRIHRWKVQGSTDQYMPAMILEKLKLAVQVASALAYLHERRLVFRDLKPHNIGLKKLPAYQSIETKSSNSSSLSNKHGDSQVIQLFDFGFCRELPNPPTEQQQLPTMMNGRTEAPLQPVQGEGESRNDASGMKEMALDSSTAGAATATTTAADTTAAATSAFHEDQVFCMSGKGTLLYMAAEVLSNSRCYNQKADVYSWSMVTYELLTLQKPFAVGSIEQHKKTVCEREERPPTSHLRWLSSSVKDLLKNSWHANVQARWHMRDIKKSLDHIIADAESRRGFRSDGSFGSFGNGSSGKTNLSSFSICQGDIDDMIVDFSNAVQTRYEKVTGFLLCGNDTSVDSRTTGGIASGKTSGVADSEVAVAGKSTATADESEKTNAGDASHEKALMNTTEEKSLRFDVDEEAEAEHEKKKEAERAAKLKVPKKPIKSSSVGQKERKEQGFYSSAQKNLTKGLFGGFARPHMSRAMRPPTTANVFEHEFCERSLSMHSVRLQAAQNRRPTAWVAPSRLTNASHGQALGQDRTLARPFASRSLRAPSSKLDATIELENEDEEEEGKEFTENSLLLPSIKMNGDQAHLDQIAEETGSSLRSTNTPTAMRSSLRSTGTPCTPSTPAAEYAVGMHIQNVEIANVGSSLRSTNTPIQEYADKCAPMTLDPNTAVGTRDTNHKNEESTEATFGSIAVSSTRIKTGEEGITQHDKSEEKKAFVVSVASV